MNIRVSLLIAASLLATAGCTRHLSRDITPDGQGGELVFPNIDKAYPKGGTRPTPEALRNIASGIEKDDLYTLVGVPHYKEGYWHVREWDYLFNLQRGDQWVKCQYKILFDKDGLGQSFHWQPAECAELVKSQSPAAGASPTQRFEVSGDALFAFGRSGIEDMLPEGRRQLDEIAQALGNSQTQRVTVVGHTDLIGDAMSNQVLSERRAQTVRNYLAAQGKVSGTISAEGHGESEPVKSCEGTMQRGALVACLQPNRRVEISGWAEK